MFKDFIKNWAFLCLFFGFVSPTISMASTLLTVDSEAVNEFYSAEKSEVQKHTDPEESLLNDNLAQIEGYFSRPRLMKLLGGSRKVVLTFDDGPHPRTTPLILQILKRRNLKAIFFVLGLQAQKFPELIKQIHDEGHLIGNHSYGHKNLAQLSEEKLREELGKTSRLIESITGSKPEFLRPPYGAMNRNVLRVANSEGMSVVMWTVDPKDWQNKNELTVLRNLDRQLGFSGGNMRGGVVLMHDIYPSTVRALGPLLDRLATNEYRVASIDKLDGNASSFWAAKGPSLLRYSAFKHNFNPEHTGNHLLINMLKVTEKAERSPMALLKAHKTGNLLLYLVMNRG